MSNLPHRLILKRPDPFLADRLFLAAHSSLTDDLPISKNALTLGLGGAMIAELVFAGRVRINAQQRAIELPEPPDSNAAQLDRVGNALLVTITNNRDVTVLREWLTYMATPTPQGDMAYTWIGDRVAGKGLATREIRRKFFFFGAEKAYYPVGAGNQLVNRGLISRIGKGGPIPPAELLLAGLIFAVGLDAAVFKDVADSSQRDRVLNHIQYSLPAPLYCIVTQVEAAVGDSVMNARY